MLKIAPSILAADFSKLGDEIKSVANADFIHIDVMDGLFVPNISIGPCLVASVRKSTALPFDVHLMIAHPLLYIEAFANSGADIISVHLEQEDSIEACINKIKQCGKLAGLAISPDTELYLLEPYLDKISLITVMSVYPGFGGQKFIEKSIDRIKAIKSFIQGYDILLSVDGGVDQSNIARLKEAGVDIVVAGSTVFKSEDRAEMIRRLRSL